MWEKSGDRGEQELENGERLIPAKNLFCKKGIELHIVNHYPQALALGVLNLKEMGSQQQPGRGLYLKLLGIL